MKDVWRYGEKISYQDIEGVQLMSKSAELRGASYVILESFADPMLLLKRFWR